MGEKIHVVLSDEAYLFLKVASVFSKRDVSEIVEMAVQMLKHYLGAGDSADGFLGFIRDRDPQLFKELMEFRYRLEEAKEKISEVVP